MSVVNVCSEYGLLEKVIVGIPFGPDDRIMAEVVNTAMVDEHTRAAE